MKNISGTTPRQGRREAAYTVHELTPRPVAARAESTSLSEETHAGHDSRDLRFRRVVWGLLLCTATGSALLAGMVLSVPIRSIAVADTESGTENAVAVIDDQARQMGLLDGHGVLGPVAVQSYRTDGPIGYPAVVRLTDADIPGTSENLARLQKEQQVSVAHLDSSSDVPDLTTPAVPRIKSATDYLAETPAVSPVLPVDMQSDPAARPGAAVDRQDPAQATSHQNQYAGAEGQGASDSAQAAVRIVGRPLQASGEARPPVEMFTQALPARNPALSHRASPESVSRPAFTAAQGPIFAPKPAANDAPAAPRRSAAGLPGTGAGGSEAPPQDSAVARTQAPQPIRTTIDISARSDAQQGSGADRPAERPQRAGALAVQAPVAEDTPPAGNVAKPAPSYRQSQLATAADAADKGTRPGLPADASDRVSEAPATAVAASDLAQ